MREIRRGRGKGRSGVGDFSAKKAHALFAALERREPCEGKTGGDAGLGAVAEREELGHDSGG